MEDQKNKSGRPTVEEKAKNINVYVKPSKVTKLGQKKTALLLKEIAELVNANESITLVIKEGLLMGWASDDFKNKSQRPSSCVVTSCSPSCTAEI